MTPPEATMLPCPFCGGEDIVPSDTGHYWFSCNTCETEGPVMKIKAEAVAAWNTRLPPLTRPEQAPDAGVVAEERDLTDKERAMIDAAWEKHRAAGPKCTVPPEGWHCTRSAGHEGPCAALPTEPEAPDGLVGDFLSQLRQVNGERATAWVGDSPSDPLFWAIELGGEVGEILNVVKKLRREELGWRGSRASTEDLADEIADGLISLDILARHYGIDLAAATVRKFNKTSEKVDLPHRLTALTAPQQPAPAADTARQEGVVERLREAIRSEVINTPETADFMAGVPIEAAHQRERWDSEHDAGKTAFDWFWLVGYLAQKAAAAQVAGDSEKALHHTISTAAALANWHAAISGASTAMRPGIEPPRAALGSDK